MEICDGFQFANFVEMILVRMRSQRMHARMLAMRELCTEVDHKANSVFEGAARFKSD